MIQFDTIKILWVGPAVPSNKSLGFDIQTDHLSQLCLQYQLISTQKRNCGHPYKITHDGSHSNAHTLSDLSKNIRIFSILFIIRAVVYLVMTEAKAVLIGYYLERSESFHSLNDFCNRIQSCPQIWLLHNHCFHILSCFDIKYREPLRNGWIAVLIGVSFLSINDARVKNINR